MDPINALAGTWLWLAAIAVLGAIYFTWRRGRTRPQPVGWDAGDESPTREAQDHAGHALPSPADTGEAGATDRGPQARPQREPEATRGARRRHGCC